MSMTAPSSRNEIVARITDHIRTTGRAPDILQIEAWANFKVKGGLGRVLTALQYSASLLAKRTELIDRVCAAVEAKHAFDDGEEISIVGSPSDLRATISEALS